MSVPTEFHSTLCKTYRTLCILVRQPITEVKAEWNVAADVRDIVKFYENNFNVNSLYIQTTEKIWL